MFAAICKLGLEGIVSKRLDAPYRSGPARSWLKTKNPKGSAATRAGIRAVQVIMRPNAADLAELARLVEKGALQPRLSKTMSLSQAGEAQELSQAGKAQGKVILNVA